MNYKQTMLYLLAFFISPCWSQMYNMEMRPDVTFDDHNDRFDISALVAQQNMYFDRQEAMQNYRRNQPDINLLAEEIRTKVQNNNDLRDFAYHDQMDSDEGDDEEEFNRNLMNFKNSRRFQKIFDYLQSEKGRRSRRDGGVSDFEKEALFHYAVPIDMKINGYIQAPLVD